MGGRDTVQLVGRERESSRLRGALMLASRGLQQVVRAGDAGIGKTTLDRRHRPPTSVVT